MTKGGRQRVADRVAQRGRLLAGDGQLELLVNDDLQLGLLAEADGAGSGRLLHDGAGDEDMSGGGGAIVPAADRGCPLVVGVAPALQLICRPFQILAPGVCFSGN